ncbi:Tfp pilus assembly protein FimT/FimU [Testudinibacter aquarius]|uniref:Prepilin peptidase dependent protein A n=1 Tax=Testudinibacter aquarius TaxID=1524974 RepID=A0A4R3YAY1_9PAST|nr:type II secretion system protein [Testudinibacter aquarius]KAE9530309.1 prepilin-type N-terminal cleavage/methylation domain-containing protein [Testudinibacter aquarius]TCV87874.1 prepilin peptidase dependent protein A [Testudinibacter aquarius]TNG89005.1 type II secretion system protein [Testudinibacter aquarius]
MAKGFTLLETLLVVFLLSALATWMLPQWQVLSDYQVLQKEQRRLFGFLRHMQLRIENSQEIWFLLINRDATKQNWCVSVQRKDNLICDCFIPQHCPQRLQAHFYYPGFPQQTRIISKKYYPAEISRLSGIRDTFSAACFVLQAGKERSIFSLFNVGSLRVKNDQAASACVHDN